MVTPVLTTKLHIPDLRRNLVPRRRLVERLDEGLRHRLTLVSAPAGFGKTTLLGEWIQSLVAGGGPAAKVAWISLDEGDNDPVRFAAYLAAALRRVDEHTGWAGGDLSELPGSLLLQEAHLVQVINKIAALPGAFILVLDDYHLITSQPVHDAIAFLVDHAPDNLHLVLATRGDPPLPLPRLRARGQLAELRQSDLRFTDKEAAGFLNEIMALDLSAEEVATLEARTEGWIAGLVMAALSLQGHGPQPGSRSAFLQDLTGSHRFILDYLVEEVLEQQPAYLQQFLLRTSILERLTGPLCDAVAGDGGLEEAGRPSDSRSILAHLEAANLFIVPLDHERRWYRYHRLFSDLLRKRLGQTSPAVVPELHRRASVWHEEQGLVAEAIDHTLAAHDFERAVALLEGIVEATLMRSEVMTFLNWVESLPDDWLCSSPSLCFYHAWAMLMSGRSLDTVETRLRDQARVQGASERPEVIAGRMAALRAYCMLLQADVQRAEELGRQALAHLPESDRFLRNAAAWIVSLARLTDGDLRDGEQSLQEVVRMAQEIGNPLIAVPALCHQAALQMRQGRLYRARELLERALHLATDPQGRRLPIASEALIGLGELEREWNDLETAASYLVEGIELARQWSPLAAFEAYFPLARIRLACGDVRAAREALDTARQIAYRSEGTQLDDLIADLQEAYFLAIQGDVAGAMHWARQRGLVPSGSSEAGPGRDEGQDVVSARLWKYERLVLARLYLLQGEATEGLDLLEPLGAQAQELGRTDLTIEIQILKALAYKLRGQGGRALEALAGALSLAEPGGYLRTFLDEGEPMADLLRQAAARDMAPAYVAKLLAAFGRPEFPEAKALPLPARAQPLVEPLSERELEVLRLLAAGMSNPEIGNELFIAVSTVRSHCKSIYGKLEVHSRREAVDRGQELGLI